MVNATIDKSKPPVQNGAVEPGKYLHMKVPPSEIAQWKEAAVREKRSLANFVRHAIESYLERSGQA